MRSHAGTGSQVTVQVAFAQPGVEVSSKTSWGDFTCFLTGVEILEFAKHLSPPRGVESRVCRDDLF